MTKHYLTVEERERLRRLMDAASAEAARERLDARAIREAVQSLVVALQPYTRFSYEISEPSPTRLVPNTPRSSEVFVIVNTTSGAKHEVHGWDELAERLCLSKNSLHSYFTSSGTGSSFIKRTLGGDPCLIYRRSKLEAARAHGLELEPKAVPPDPKQPVQRYKTPLPRSAEG